MNKILLNYSVFAPHNGRRIAIAAEPAVVERGDHWPSHGFPDFAFAGRQCLDVWDIAAVTRSYSTRQHIRLALVVSCGWPLATVCPADIWCLTISQAYEGFRIMVQ